MREDVTRMEAAVAIQMMRLGIGDGWKQKREEATAVLLNMMKKRMRIVSSRRGKRRGRGVEAGGAANIKFFNGGEGVPFYDFCHQRGGPPNPVGL